MDVWFSFQLALKHHPDKNPDNVDFANTKVSACLQNNVAFSLFCLFPIMCSQYKCVEAVCNPCIPVVHTAAARNVCGYPLHWTLLAARPESRP